MRMEYFYEMWNWIDMMVISGMSECQKVNKCQYIKILKCRQRYQNFNRFQYGDVALKCPTNKKIQMSGEITTTTKFCIKSVKRLRIQAFHVKFVSFN